MPTEPHPLTHAEIATRMHTVITQWLGDAFDVDRMLADPAEAREVLFVCQASNQPELVGLAQQWLALGPMHAAIAPSTRSPSPAGAERPRPDAVMASEMPALFTATIGRVPQHAPWTPDTSGFGASAPGVMTASACAPETPRWRQRPRWLGGPGRGRSAG